MQVNLTSMMVPKNFHPPQEQTALGPLAAGMIATLIVGYDENFESKAATWIDQLLKQ